jgi:hypothetical protein
MLFLCTTHLFWWPKTGENYFFLSLIPKKHKMEFVTLFQLVYLFLIKAVTAQDTSYKKMLIPASNSSMLAYENKTGIASKIECASFCNLNSPKCKTYFYNRTNQICQLMDFDLISNVAAENSYGYVDLSMCFIHNYFPVIPNYNNIHNIITFQ